jgi:hypothetical protein
MNHYMQVSAMVANMAGDAVKEAKGTALDSASVVGETVGRVFQGIGSASSTAANQASTAAKGVCAECTANQIASIAAGVAAKMAIGAAFSPEVVGAEAAQAAMENGGSEPAVAIAAAKAAGEASIAMGGTVAQATLKAYQACRLQIYDSNNDMLCFLGPASVIGQKYADDGKTPYEAGVAAALASLGIGGSSEISAQAGGEAIITASIYLSAPVDVAEGAVTAALAAGGDIVLGIQKAAVAIIGGREGMYIPEDQAAEAGAASAAAVLKIGGVPAEAIATAGAVAGALIEEKAG